MSTQTFACPACGSRKTLDNPQPAEKIHCTCGMSYPASPVFAVPDTVGEKTSGPGLAVAVVVALLIGCGGSAIWIMMRPAPHTSLPLGPVAVNSAPTEPPPGVPDEKAKPVQPHDKSPTNVPPATPQDPIPPKPPTPPPPAASVSAVTLWDAFDLDPASAGDRFTGKLVEVMARGRLGRDTIDRPFFGAEVVKPRGRTKGRMTDQEKQWERDGYPPNVRCYLSAEQAAALANAPADKDVVLRGICTGRKERDDVYRGYIVELDNCTVVTK
jgi:hypothetical protein